MAGCKEKRIIVILFYWSYLRHQTYNKNNTLILTLSLILLKSILQRKWHHHLHITHTYHYCTKSSCLVFFMQISSAFVTNWEKKQTTLAQLSSKELPHLFPIHQVALSVQKGLGHGSVLETVGALLLCDWTLWVGPLLFHFTHCCERLVCSSGVIQKQSRGKCSNKVPQKKT